MSLERAKKHLEKYGLADRIRLTEESSATVELAAAAVGVEPGRIAKTLSFIVKERPVLILAEGTARIDNRKFKGREAGRACPGGRLPIRNQRRNSGLSGHIS